MQEPLIKENRTLKLLESLGLHIFTMINRREEEWRRERNLLVYDYMYIM